MSIFEPVLRDEEKRDAFAEVYEAVRAGLEAYELLTDRMMRRVYRMERN